MTTVQTVAQSLATAIRAQRDCESSGNVEWSEKWQARIDAIMDDAPSGSGFDSGTSLGDRATDRRLTFLTSYHHMNEGGFYDGWTEHIVTCEATFDGIALKISGRNRNDIKDYIGDVFHTWLTQEWAMV